MATRPVKLKMLPRSTMKAKVSTRLTGQVVAGTGITVTKAAGVFTVAVDLADSAVVTGPVLSTDNAIARFDGTDGTVLQNSAVTIGDTGVFAGGAWNGTVGATARAAGAFSGVGIGAAYTATYPLEMTTATASSFVSQTNSASNWLLGPSTGLGATGKGWGLFNYTLANWALQFDDSNVATLGYATLSGGALKLQNSSGTATFTPTATATFTLPNASGTVAVSASAPLVLNATTGNLTVTGAALTKTDDTNVTLTLGGAPTTALLAATSMTLGWTGTLALSRLAQGTDGQLIVGQTSASSLYKSITGDWTLSAAGAATLATVNSNVGTFGSATQASQITVNAKGLITAAVNVTITPAVGSITGLGTGVGTALAIAVGSAGGPVTNGGALGSPSSAGTLPAFTLGGPISGGGNQLNNIIIGTTTPLAGFFTTLSATGHVTVEGVTSTGATGTGRFVFDGSPTLVTPNLGTPSAINLANATNLPLAALPAIIAARGSFHATKNATNQTGIADSTFTKITFTTEDFDIGSFYDSTNSKWTPPGKIAVSVQFYVTGTFVAGNVLLCGIYKNGSLYKNTDAFAANTGAVFANVFAIIDANGTDYFEFYLYADTSAGTATVDGGVAYSYACGTVLQ